MVGFERNIICIFMNINENIRNEWKKRGESKGCAYESTPISITYCPIVQNLKSNECHEAGLLLNCVYTDYLIYISMNINGNIRSRETSQKN